MAISGRQIIKSFVPPIVWQWRAAWQRFWGGEKPEWEYAGAEWPAAEENTAGWNDPSVAEAQLSKWPLFLQLLEGTGPLGIAHEAASPGRYDPTAHHLIMAWGYVLGRISRGRQRITLLDWGGGLGHYLLLSRALLPELEIEYFCRDLPLLCRAGRRLHPGAVFYENDDAALSRTYDLILASGSLQYARDWRRLLRRLAGAAQGHLFIARLPVVENSRSFVIRQRPHAYGYMTEYVGWILCREEFLACAADCGLKLWRELLGEESPFIAEAPAQPQYRGYLFAAAGR
ncbi:MAG: hypothetical protein N3A66_09590 [Planctomycetota bacterium]|nr:hypothetical protein [Planctomycetota bacterium]